MKEIINLISDDEEELPSGPSAGIDSISSVSAVATSRNPSSPSPIKVSATTTSSTCGLLQVPSGHSVGFQSLRSNSIFSQSNTTIEKDLADKTSNPDSPPKFRIHQDTLGVLSKSILRSKTCKIEDTPSDTPHESSKPNERPSTEIERPSPPRTSINEFGSFPPRLRCSAGAFEFCNDKQYWDIRLCSLVPFEDSSHQSFTDLCKAIVKLEFFVDFPKPINGKYIKTEVPFIPTEIINQVVPDEKSFWNAMNSRKKENRKQVLTKSASNLVNLVKAIQYWPHPESSESDRQELYKKVAQMESAMIYFLSDIADAVDVKQIYISAITGNELAKEWASLIINLILEKKWQEEQWEQTQHSKARQELNPIEASGDRDKKEIACRKLLQGSDNIKEIGDRLKKRWTEFVRDEWNEDFFAAWGERARLALADVPVDDMAFGMPTRPSRGIFLQAICEAQGSSLHRHLENCLECK